MVSSTDESFQRVSRIDRSKGQPLRLAMRRYETQKQQEERKVTEAFRDDATLYTAKSKCRTFQRTPT